MDWRQLLRIFTNNEQLIQRLSETGPIRYAARMSVYWFIQARQKGLEKFTKPDPKATSENASRLKSFSETFKKELDKGLKDLDKEKKNKP